MPKSTQWARRVLEFTEALPATETPETQRRVEATESHTSGSQEGDRLAQAFNGTEEKVKPHGDKP